MAFNYNKLSAQALDCHFIFDAIGEMNPITVKQIMWKNTHVWINSVFLYRNRFINQQNKKHHWIQFLRPFKRFQLPLGLINVIHQKWTKQLAECHRIQHILIELEVEKNLYIISTKLQLVPERIMPLEM